jgi:hypothetical protein
MFTTGVADSKAVRENAAIVPCDWSFSPGNSPHRHGCCAGACPARWPQRGPGGPGISPEGGA